jgi:hypothetical protein
VGAAFGGGASVDHGGTRRRHWVVADTSWRRRFAASRPHALGGRPGAATRGQPKRRAGGRRGRERPNKENGVLKRLAAVTPRRFGPSVDNFSSEARLSCEAQINLHSSAWLWPLFI